MRLEPSLSPLLTYWNGLADNIRSCDNLSTFKSLHRTYPFRKAYYC